MVYAKFGGQTECIMGNWKIENNTFLSYLGMFPFQYACMSCLITRKSRASIRGKLHHCQTYMRHFNHRRKYTACSSRDSCAYSESRHDSYPQFPRSWLGTRGLQSRSHRQKKERTTLLSVALLKQARLITTLLLIQAFYFIFHQQQNQPG